MRSILVSRCGQSAIVLKTIGYLLISTNYEEKVDVYVPMPLHIVMMGQGNRCQAEVGKQMYYFFWHDLPIYRSVNRAITWHDLPIYRLQAHSALLAKLQQNIRI